MRSRVGRITSVWILLSALTIVSWWLASTRAGGESQASSWEAVAVLTIASVKARFVARDFMEVRHAPAWLQWSVDGWVVALLAAVVAIYLA